MTTPVPDTSALLGHVFAAFIVQWGNVESECHFSYSYCTDQNKTQYSTYFSGCGQFEKGVAFFQVKS